MLPETEPARKGDFPLEPWRANPLSLSVRASGHTSLHIYKLCQAGSDEDTLSAGKKVSSDTWT